MTSLLTSALTTYNDGTNRYQPEVVKSKRRDMEQKINKEFHSLFRSQTAHLLKDAIRSFNADLTAGAH
jgi:hypothetical protein